jgi:hypothetical protein
MLNARGSGIGDKQDLFFAMEKIPYFIRKIAQIRLSEYGGGGSDE